MWANNDLICVTRYSTFKEIAEIKYSTTAVI